MRVIWKLVLLFVTFAATFGIMVMVTGCLAWLLWNHVAVPKFGVPALGFWETIALMTLVRLCVAATPASTEKR